jgi:hypothetical protein
VAVLSGLVGTGASLGESGPPDEGSEAQVPAIEAVRLAEAYRLVEEVGNRIWPGIDSLPFPVLLVTVLETLGQPSKRSSTDEQIGLECLGVFDLSLCDGFDSCRRAAEKRDPCRVDGHVDNGHRVVEPAGSERGLRAIGAMVLFVRLPRGKRF